jgi:hypothetical protein
MGSMTLILLLLTPCILAALFFAALILGDRKAGGVDE